MKRVKARLHKASTGEGSRGGKIIGHTRSGKPVYQKQYDSEGNLHDGFDHHDHLDAVNFHKKHALALENDYADDIKIDTEALHDHHTGIEHHAAEARGSAKNHSFDDRYNSEKKSKAHVEKHMNKKSKVKKAIDVLHDAIRKAGGEGSRGGKIIGHTRSGKPIYDRHDHPDHKGFNLEEHRDAMQVHHQLDLHLMYNDNEKWKNHPRPDHEDHMYGHDLEIRKLEKNRDEYRAAARKSKAAYPVQLVRGKYSPEYIGKPGAAAPWNNGGNGR